jgi:DNA repair exonuclease SbcCD ATPase subunit
MSGLKPSKLILEGFRSYKDRSEIHFPENGTLMITGSDINNGISSGAGKSSIVEAIAFALGFSSLPTTELKNWYSKSIFVSLTLSNGSDSYEIIRDPKLKIIKNGVPYEGLSSGAEDELKLILGCGPEIAKALTYRAQLESGRFINSTDSKNKDFLSSCIIGLDEIDRLADLFETKSKDVHSKIDALTVEVNTLERVLGEVSVDLSSLQEAKGVLDRTNKAIEDFNGSESQISALRISAQNAEKYLDNLRNVGFKARNAQSENDQIKQLIMSMRQEMEYLHAATCPTCKQKWESQSAKDKIAELNEKSGSYIDKFENNLTYIKNAKVALDGESHIKQEYNDIQNKIAEFKAPYTSLLREQTMAKMAFDEKVQRARAISNNRERLEKSASLKTAFDETAKVYGHLSSIFSRNGFLGSIFEEIIKEIEMRTNDMVALMPNISRFTVQISTEAEQKNGKTKKSISTRLLKDGKEISVKTLSGGQKRSLELCTDLAVSETIRARSGSSLSWMILDEALDNLDVEPKKYAIEMIKQKVQGLVIIIDHATEIKEIFDSVISVKYNGRDSYIN